MRNWLFMPIFGLSCALLVVEPATAQTYTVTDLGLLPGYGFSMASGVNESGQVTGYVGSFLPGGVAAAGHAFLYRDGKLLDLGTLGGPSSIGIGITGDEGKDPSQGDDGKRKIRVTGLANTGQGQAHAFLYEDHFMRDLGVLPGGTTSFGYAVNRSGEVVGRADDAEGVLQPFLYKNGNMVILATPGGAGGEALGINHQGDVTGAANTTEGYYHAFLYHNGKMIDLGTLPGGVSSSGKAINDGLQITGVSYPINPLNAHAFLWSKGNMTDLGVLPTGSSSSGASINAWGQVVGEADVNLPSGGDIDHAFLYSNGQMHDLNDMIPSNSGWSLESATGINNRGEIAGTGIINGETHGFLLTLDCKH